MRKCSPADKYAAQWMMTSKEAQVRGDAFLARVRDCEEEFQRLDFTLQEVSSSAPWVKARMRFPLILMHERTSAPFMHVGTR